MAEQMTPHEALTRLGQYGEHKGLTVATYDSGTERALHEIATTLAVEVERLAGQVERVRARHRGVCFGRCGQQGECDCAEADLFCEECNEHWPCGTIRDLDKEAGR